MPKRIEPPFDVTSFVQHGHQFYWNMNLIGKLKEAEFANYATPFVTCAALALEIYFKVLTHIDRGLLPLKTHNLLHLYYDTAPETQKRLEDEWTEKHLPGLQRHGASPALPKDFPRVENFRQALQDAAGAFVDWRYAPCSKNRSFSLPDLIPIAGRLIREKRPDLGPRREIVTKFSLDDPRPTFPDR